MKIYFDGCSHTWGAGLDTPELLRYSKIVSDHFGAEEHNIARRGGSDKRVLRNLLETDLEPYDYVIVQLTCKNRTEFFDDDSKKWIGINLEALRRQGMISSRLSEAKNLFWKNYWRDIYTDKLGLINQMTIYHAMRNILKDKKHLIIAIMSRGQINQAPVDINFTTIESHNTVKYESGGFDRIKQKKDTWHPSQEGHKQIASEIIRCISM